jgi:HKD family nuclease
MNHFMKEIWNKHNNNHNEAIRALFAKAIHLRIACPFVRFNAIRKLFGRNVDHFDREIRFLGLWSAWIFIQGVCDLEAFEFLLDAGAEVRVMRSELHAKVYIADSATAIVTSANLTEAGLERNLECGLLIEGQAVQSIVQNFDFEWRRATPISPEDVQKAKGLIEGIKLQRQSWWEEGKKLDQQLAAGLQSVVTVRDPDTDDILVELTGEQIEILNRPVTGSGGYQSLLRRLQDNLNGNLLRLTKNDCERIVRSATKYGAGGFQTRLRSILETANRYLQ